MKAPFTDDQVKSLKEYQESGIFHPFTCGGKDCREDLEPTNNGWVCKSCEYTQDWCHEWMANWEWKNELL